MVVWSDRLALSTTPVAAGADLAPETEKRSRD
jgi:hypothetical protein